MSTGNLRVFHSSGRPGASTEIGDDPRRVVARKLEREVQVRFTDVDCTVQTPEGLVHAKPGDAILTGAGGHQWRVSRARFADKYRALPPTRPGEPGAYMSLPNRIVAVRMTESFEVMLADGLSRLTGHPGDWLVDYRDGSLGVVAEAVFEATYEIPG